VPIGAGAQVERFGVGQCLTVLDLVDEDVAIEGAWIGLRTGAADKLLQCAAQGVVRGGEVVAALSQARMGLPVTSFNIQRAPASILSWWMRLPSMS
jgi:hypothetical protein